MLKANKNLKMVALVCVIAVVLTFFSGCDEFDKDYGTQSEISSSAKEDSADMSIPEIKSDDTVMPNYVDISRYDEENYSKTYLGKKFKFKITYAGSEITVPTTFKKMKAIGFDFADGVDTDSTALVLAGKTLEIDLVNGYSNRITAVFYNSANSSKSLTKCPIVKFIVKENVIYNDATDYGQFWVNGVSNESAITDIIEYLGEPSHFYAVSENEYYLDYFITESDRRNGITIFVDPANDSVKSIEFSYYK